MIKKLVFKLIRHIWPNVIIWYIIVYYTIQIYWKIWTLTSSKNSLEYLDNAAIYWPNHALSFAQNALSTLKNLQKKTEHTN